MKPIKFEYLTNSEIEKDLSKIQLAIRGIGDESYISFNRLLNNSNRAFNALSDSTSKQAIILNSLIQDMRQNEIAQESLFQQWEKGNISCDEYADKQAKLSKQLAELKAEVSELSEEIKREIQLNNIAKKSLEEKISIVAKLREEYAQLSAEEQNNELVGTLLLSRIRALDTQINSMSTNMNGAKEDASGLTGGLGDFLELITDGASKLQVFSSLMKTITASRFAPHIAAIAASFLILRNSILGNKELTEKTNAIKAFFLNLQETYKQMVAKFNSLNTDLVFGGPDKIRDSWQTFVQLFKKQGMYAWKNAEGYLNLDNLNNSKINNDGQISRNVSAIQKDKILLMDQNKSLEEKKDIVANILKLEKESYNLNAKSLKEEFKSFSLINSRELDVVRLKRPNELNFAEGAFNTMTELGELSTDDQNKLMDTVSEITNDSRIQWSDEQKKQYRSFFDAAIQISSDYSNECLRINTELNNSIRLENLTTIDEIKKTSLEELQEEVQQRKKQYATLNEFEQNLGKELADQDFKELKSHGKNYISYLTGKINEIQSIPNQTKNDRMSLNYLMTERNEATPKPDISAFKNTIEEKKELYKDDLNSYMQYLQEIRKQIENDSSAEGILKRDTLDNEIKVTQQLQKKELDEQQKQKANELNNLLKQYQTYTVKMASLKADYEKDNELLKNAKKNAKPGEDVSRIDDAIIARKNSYDQSRAELDAENSEFSQVLFGNLEKISNSSLNKAINEARAFIAKLRKKGNITPEMESFLKNIENGIDTAEKKKASRLPEDLMDAANALQECANLANVFDGELGDVLQTAANVAKGAADIAGGIAQFSTNPLQGATSILSGITGIIGGIGSRLKENQKIREEYQQGLLETYSKELEYNSILRDRLRTQQQIGETTLQYSQRLQKELTAQKGSIDQEYQQVWGKLMNEQYISGTGYKHGTWFRKAKTWNEYSSLSGKSYEQIEGLYTQDKLDGAAKTLFERLKALKEEGANVVEMMDQLNEQMRENWTGTTATAISDSIVQGFLDGKKSAADFAADFEGLMRTAMLQSVKMKYLDAPLRDWYERFAAESENGLSQGKIEELRKAYDQIIESAAKEAENIEKITGISMGADEQAREASAKGIQSISQESADQLLGTANTLTYITSNIDKNVTSIHSLMIDAARQWVQIAYNTSYCVKLETMEQDLKAMRMTVQGMSDNGILMRSR